MVRQLLYTGGTFEYLVNTADTWWVDNLVTGLLLAADIGSVEWSNRFAAAFEPYWPASTDQSFYTSVAKIVDKVEKRYSMRLPFPR